MVVREQILNRVMKRIDEEMEKQAGKRLAKTQQLNAMYAVLRALKRKRYDYISGNTGKCLQYKPEATFTNGSAKDKAYVEEIWKLGKALYPNTYNVPLCVNSTSLAEYDDAEFSRILAGCRSSRKFSLHEESNQRGGINHKLIRKDRWYCGYGYKGIGTLGKPIVFKRNDSVYLGGKVDGGFYKYWALEEFRLNKRAVEFGAFCQRPAGVYDIHKTVAGRRLAVFVRMVSSPIRMSKFLTSGGFDSYLTIRYGSPSISAFRKYLSSLARIIAENIKSFHKAGVIYGEFDLRNTSSEGEFCDFEPAFKFDGIDGAAPLISKEEFIPTIKSSLSIMEEFCRHIFAHNSLNFSKSQALEAYKKVFIREFASSFSLKPSNDKNRLALGVLKHGLD